MPTVHRKPFGRAHGQSETGLWTLDSGTGVRAGLRVLNTPANHRAGSVVSLSGL